VARFLLTLLAGIALGAAATWYLLEGPPGAHPAVGRWQGPLVSLRLAPDGTGTITGVALTWTERDDDTVQLRYTKEGDDLVVDLDVTGADEAVLRLPVLPVTLQRVQVAPGDG